MSFNAKNLSYEKNEPAFLRKLRGQYGSGASDRHERQIQRPKKPRNDDDDDGPTYVDEDGGNIISKDEYEAMVRGEDGQDKSAGEEDAADKKYPQPESKGEEVDKSTAKTKENLAGIGAQKKRKQAKVVGNGDNVEDAERNPDKETKGQKGKQKKAKKKIKLSFDEPNEA